MGKYFLDLEDRTIWATEEQEAIIDIALSTSDSLLINALAGSAKSTTLEFLVKYLPIQAILSIAFNKRIVEALTKRLPGHVKCKTINGTGHGVWAPVCPGKLTVDTKKSYNILKGIVDGLSRQEKSEAYDTFGDTLKTIGRAKSAGYIPDGKFPEAHRIITGEEFFGSLDEDFDRALVDATLIESIRQSYNGLIDFDDQIYMPTLFGGSFPNFPLVLIDEAQDLSPLNHEMLKKLARNRLIAVGDPWQSIYGFRGSVRNGMAHLKDHFGLKEMTLSVSFRCPVEIVKRAQERVPHMRWASTARQGAFHVLDTWSASTIADNSAIICRNNAPLFSLAFKLIRSGRGVSLVGFDIGPSLIKTLKKLGPTTLPREEAYHEVDKWEAERLRRRKPPATVSDRAECLRVFLDFGTTLGESIAYAEGIFASRGPIQLLSGHKAKGLEWETVYHLDPWRIPSAYAKSEEDLDQELNVRYVIETRAKNTLFHVDMRGFE